MKRSIVSAICFVILACVATSQTKEAMTGNTSTLGTYSRLILSCKDIIQSLTWWTKLGFNPIPSKDMRPDSALTISDGQIVLTLVKESLPSPIVVFSNSRMMDLKDTLDKKDINGTFDIKGPSYGEVRLLSPNGVYIMVRQSSDELVSPRTGDSNIVCGKNTELSIGTGYLKKEKDYWLKLGLNVKREDRNPYPYALMTDGDVVIGLHENRDIASLTITYFAQDMPDRIARLQKLGMNIEEEVPDPSGKLSHGRLISPDGQMVFLFTGSQ